MRSKLRNVSLLSFDSVFVVPSFVVRRSDMMFSMTFYCCTFNFLMAAYSLICSMFNVHGRPNKIFSYPSILYSHIIIIYHTTFPEWHGKTLLMAFLQVIFRFEFHWLKIFFGFLSFFFFFFFDFYMPYYTTNAKKSKRFSIVTSFRSDFYLKHIYLFCCIRAIPFHQCSQVEYDKNKEVGQFDSWLRNRIRL